MTGVAAAFRVLVVDDDPDMAEFLARLLAKEGMAADTVSDGESALARIASAPPDLILLDVMLPGADGFAICERVKAEPARSRAPRSVSVSAPCSTPFSSVSTPAANRIASASHTARG